MVLPDVNVLIHAFRPDSDRHSICKSWLENIVAGDARFGIAPLALSAVARIATNPRVFKTPSLIQEVFAFGDELLSQPHCEIVEPGERHWGIFKRLCAEAEARRPLISDAWYAALAIERGCVFVTFDRDFARFPGLEWRAPT
jgi:toxin-antitoxin system PIN domain toxin